MTLLELQVADLREDVTVVQGDVADLDQDVNFLFDEQVIQDERLLNLEVATVSINAQLGAVDDELEGEEHVSTFLGRYSDSFDTKVNYFHVAFTGSQDTTLALDFRVTVLEENGGDGGNSSVAELELRVETLEGTAADHETRLTAAETDIEGKISLQHWVFIIAGIIL